MSSWAWGVDVSTTRVAVGAVRADGAWSAWHEDVFERGERADGRRLSFLRAVAVTMAQRTPLNARPELILIEDPANRHHSFHLLASAGVVLEAFHSVFRRPVVPVPVPVWKKAVLGRGNARKGDVAARAQQLGLPADRPQDEADALCIALCALGRLEGA